MAQLGMNIPDDFQNELLRRKARTGQSIRFQILDALRKQWGWDTTSMPKDGRFKIPEQDIPEPKFSGHSPKNTPLAPDGFPDFDAMLAPHLPKKDEF